MVSSSSPKNIIVFYGKALLSLWSLPAHKGISLNVVWFKSVFHVYTKPFKTPHGLIRKNESMIKRVLYSYIGLSVLVTGDY